jgi:hypothetical protein
MIGTLTMSVIALLFAVWVGIERAENRKLLKRLRADQKAESTSPDTLSG